MAQAPALEAGSAGGEAADARPEDRPAFTGLAAVFELRLAIRTTDLTTLEGADTPGKAAAVASKARRPDPSDPTVPACAAVCVYPNLIQAVRERLGDSGVKVAAVATGFPSGQYQTAIKVADVRAAVELGADEIEIASFLELKTVWHPMGQ